MPLDISEVKTPAAGYTPLRYMPSADTAASQALARAMHDDGVAKAKAKGVEQEYVRVPGTDIGMPNLLPSIQKGIPDSRITVADGKTFIEQNLLQPSPNIDSRIMERRFGRLSREYIGALTGMAGKPEEAAARVHDIWAACNENRRETSPQLFVPYADLPEVEKAKDREIAGLVMKHIPADKQTSGETPGLDGPTFSREVTSAARERNGRFPMPTGRFM